MNLAKSFYSRMAGDPVLTALLGTYEGGPAVFTGDPPDNAAMPWIIVGGSAGDTPFDTKTTRGREVWKDVQCYAPKTESTVTIDAIAERVRELFHRHSLEVDGYEVWVADVSGPTGADEQDAYGRIVEVHLKLVEG